ncbi:MAG: hypothetical protein M1830_002466 [Pleopsidium flavum]|nr:MAG: hypothetical protein M1830_002466 [Pleopsidium flavum]
MSLPDNKWQQLFVKCTRLLHPTKAGYKYEDMAYCGFLQTTSYHNHFDNDNMQLTKSISVAVFLHAMLIDAIPPCRRRERNETSILGPVSTINITLTAQTQPGIDDIATTLIHEFVTAASRRVADINSIQPIATGFVGLPPTTINKANTTYGQSIARLPLTRPGYLPETSFITVTTTRIDTHIANTIPAQSQKIQPSTIIGGGSAAKASIQESRDSTTSSIPTTSELPKYLSEAKSSITNNPYPYPHHQASTTAESVHKETTSPLIYNPYPYPHRHSTELASASPSPLTRETSSTSTYNPYPYPLDHQE